MFIKYVGLYTLCVRSVVYTDRLLESVCMCVCLLVLMGSINWVLEKDAPTNSNCKVSLHPIKISLATWPLLNSYLVHSLF